MAIEIEHAVTDRGPRGSRSVRLVFLAIARAADEYGFAYAGEEHLSRQALCDERTVRRAVQQLERAGWLAVRRKSIGGRASVYFVNMAKLTIGQHPGGSCRPLGKQKPKNPMHLDLERRAQVRFASGGKPPIGERNVRPASGDDLFPIGGHGVRFASGGKPPIGEHHDVDLPSGGHAMVGGKPDSQEIPPDIGERNVRLASGGRPPIGEHHDVAAHGEELPSGGHAMVGGKPDFQEIPPDILNKSHRTFLTFPPDIFDVPLSIKSIKSKGKSITPIPLPLSLAVETVQEQPQTQVLPDEAKSERQATASATATAGRGNIVQMGTQQRREMRESRRWEAATREGIEAGVGAAAGRVMRTCGFTEARLLRVIVVAIEARLAADRTSEVAAVELAMVKAWNSVIASSELMRFSVTPRYFFTDGRWAASGMWPFDEQRLANHRRARVGT